MIVVMKPGSTTEHVGHVREVLGKQGVNGWPIEREVQTVVEILDGNGRVDRAALENLPMVDRVVEHAGALKAADRTPGDQTCEIALGEAALVGGHQLAVIAGPCAVESKGQLLEIASSAKDAGAVALRGGAFKPRTSPYTFQGLGEYGLELLALAREQTGLAIVTEVMRCEHVELVAGYADVLQVGSRNMHNTHLLTTVGRQRKPVLLKRGWSASLEEFLLAAEYIMLEGNPKVVLCERGIRTHETYVRNTLALAIVPQLKRVSRLPVIVDPSHGTGRSHLVAPMTKAAIACGADGLLIEVHQAPHEAWSDGTQSIDLNEFRSLMTDLQPFATAANRGL